MFRLKELRESRGLNQAELGKRFGLSISTISMYESGKREPSFETVVKFANFFGVSIDYLLGQEKSSDIDKIVPKDDEEREFILLLRSSDDIHRRLAAGILQASAKNAQPGKNL